MSADAKLRERVENVLLKYDAAKLRTVDTLISSFDSKEQQLMSALSRKYGPEPAQEEVVRLRDEKGLPPSILFQTDGDAQDAAPLPPPLPPTAPAVSKQRATPPTKTKSKIPLAPAQKPSGDGHAGPASPLQPRGAPGQAAGSTSAKPSGDAAAGPPSPLQPRGKQQVAPGQAAGSTSAKATPPTTPGRKSSPGSKPPSHPPTPPSSSPRRAASPARAPSAKGTPDATRKSTPSRSATPKAPTPTKPSNAAPDSAAAPTPPSATAAPPPPKRPKSAAVAGKAAKAAPAPPAAAAPANVRHDAHVQTLTEIYTQHAPEKVSDVEKVLSNHANEIQELFQAIENKYQLPNGHVMRRVDELVAEATPASRTASSLSGTKSQQNPPAPSPVALEAPGSVGGVDLAPQPSQGAHAPNKSVQETSRQLVSEVVEDFFQEHAPDRVAQVPQLMQQYQDRQQDLFRALQQEFSKPPMYFKRLLSAKSKIAADALVKKGSYVRGATATAAATGPATLRPSEQLWQSIAQAGTSSSAAAPPRVYTFREQVEFFCDKFCPMKSELVEKALRVYHGRELELMHSLHAAYGVHHASEYLPAAAAPMGSSDVGGSSAGAARQRRGIGEPDSVASSSGMNDPNDGQRNIDKIPTSKIPESMRAAAELARHFGLGPQFVPRVIEQYGREDPKRVMFELLAALFPDAMAHAFATQEQRIAFTARRVATFLSFHHPSAKGAVGRIVAQYARAGKLDDALADLLLRYYGSLLEAVPMKSFTPMDLTGGAAVGQPSLSQLGSDNDATTLSRMISAVDLQASPSRSLQELDSSAFSPPSGVFAPDPSGQHGDVAAEVLLRRREFKRSLDEWQQHYSGSSPFARSTPRALGKMSETASSATTTADLPRDVKHASVLTFHREQEEARLLGMVERGMVTDPFNFNIASYQDAVDKGRRHFGGPTSSDVSGGGLSAMRSERHRELYGSQGKLLSDVYTGQRTPISNPMIFLEDDDCSKCRVLKHQLDAATQRLHGIRAQQQYRDRLQKYEDMEQRAAEEAMLTSIRRNRDGTSSTWMGGSACGSCKELQQQVHQLSTKLHCLRTRRTSASLDEEVDGIGARDSPTRRRSAVSWNTEAAIGGSPQRYQRRDATTMTDLDSVKFSDLRNYFILDAL